MGDAQADDVLGRATGQRLATEADRAFGAAHAADRPQRRCLAGAIGAEQGGDAALRDIEIQPVQHMRRAVAGLQAARLKQHGRSRGHRPDRHG